MWYIGAINKNYAIKNIRMLSFFYIRAMGFEFNISVSGSLMSSSRDEIGSDLEV